MTDQARGNARRRKTDITFGARPADVHDRHAWIMHEPAELAGAPAQVEVFAAEGEAFVPAAQLLEPAPFDQHGSAEQHIHFAGPLGRRSPAAIGAVARAKPPGQPSRPRAMRESGDRWLFAVRRLQP